MNCFAIHWSSDINNRAHKRVEHRAHQYAEHSQHVMQDSPNGFLAFLQENTAERNWIGDHLIAKLDTALNSDTRAALAIFNPQLSGYARRSQKRNRMEEQNADRFHSRRSNSPQ